MNIENRHLASTHLSDREHVSLRLEELWRAFYKTIQRGETVRAQEISVEIRMVERGLLEKADTSIIN